MMVLQMLVDDIGDVTITNDGATILKLLEVEHPAAKVKPLQSIINFVHHTLRLQCLEHTSAELILAQHQWSLLQLRF